jgi:hypothetical protein
METSAHKTQGLDGVDSRLLSYHHPELGRESRGHGYVVHVGRERDNLHSHLFPHNGSKTKEESGHSYMVPCSNFILQRANT